MNDDFNKLSMSGKIASLYVKTKRGKPTVALDPGDFLVCETGFGIVGDVHANRLSPRQVLITIVSELGDLEITPGALQENIVISSSRPDLFRPGSAIVTESGVEIRLTMYCEPCKHIAHVEKELAKLINRRGVLGVFEKGGQIAKGDAFELVGSKYQPLPESAYQKFLDFVPTIPPGRVVRYFDVTVGMGVADSFVRALPGYIRRSLGKGLPLHRIVNARGELLDFIPDQAKLLESEGAELHGGYDVFNKGGRSVSLSRYLWQG